ncbi:peptidoglycan-binding protein, partial [Candidatus Parcubacteria bacterium]|nr:peptidoglycan-binding protein [Candidatus Parcubacteria bacterium]
SGSNSIYYNAGDAPADPSCSSGTLYGGTISLISTQTIKAIGCDTAGNHSAVASLGYTITRGSSSGGGGHSSVPRANIAAFTTPAGNTVQASPNAKPAFTRDLKTGASGVDVKALQQFLNTHGFMITTSGPGSKGNETMTFGALTRAALVKYQMSKGISPAAGYLGPKTKAAIAVEQ